MRNYEITREDCLVVACAAAVGFLVFLPLSGDLPTAVICAIIGSLLTGAVIVLHKMCGFSTTAETPWKRRIQTVAWLTVAAVFVGAVVDAAWSGNWFAFPFVLFLLIPFLFLSRHFWPRILVAVLTVPRRLRRRE